MTWSCRLQEKQQAVLAEQEEQQRMDLMMEIERLRALEAYQVRQQTLGLSLAQYASTTCTQQLAGHLQWRLCDALPRPTRRGSWLW